MAGQPVSKWATRFVLAAIVQGGVAFVIMAYLLGLSVAGVPVSRAVAGGGIATWLLVGFLGFLVVGVVAVAVTALFYDYIEVRRGAPYSGYREWLAWGHLILMNVGALAASVILIWVGLWGGVALQPVESGGWGWNAGQVHTNIAAWSPEPIAVFMALGALGILLGGVGFVTSWLSKRKA